MRTFAMRAVILLSSAGLLLCTGCSTAEDTAALPGELGADLVRQLLAAFLL